MSRPNKTFIFFRETRPDAESDILERLKEDGHVCDAACGQLGPGRRQQRGRSRFACGFHLTIQAGWTRTKALVSKTDCGAGQLCVSCQGLGYVLVHLPAPPMSAVQRPESTSSRNPHLGLPMRSLFRDWLALGCARIEHASMRSIN